jgi:hypothetical protein
MTRYQYIEKLLRVIYNGQPSDDSTISFSLVNTWLSEGIAMASKKNWVDNAQMDGMPYINNGFYQTFSGLSISKSANYLYQVTLPQIPIGIGKNEGVSSLTIKDSNNNISFDAVPLSENQSTYYRSMRPIQNKLMYKTEGINLFILSPLVLSAGNYSANVRMVSGGDSTNLDSVLNVPDDYLSLIDEFLIPKLLLEKQQGADLMNDGMETQKTA